MKYKFTKIHKLNFSFGIVALAAGLSLLFVQPAQAEIQDCNPALPTGVNETIVETSWIKLQLPIPGVTTTCYEASVDASGGFKTVYYIQDVASYIAGLYKFIAGSIGIIATMMVFYAGIRWITAAGNRSRVQDAKETLFSALAAVVLAMGSYLLLYTINPRLVNLRVPTLTPVVGQIQRMDTCPTFKQCQSGNSTGIACNTDADCGAAVGSGACSYGVDLGTDTVPKCGKNYSYLLTKEQKESGQEVSGVATCRGVGCGANESCVQGTYESSLLGAGAMVISPGILIPGIAFDQQPVTGATFACVDQQSACENITDNSDEVDSGTHDNLCKHYSVPGAGMCGWWDESWYTIKPDRCIWRPILTCEPGYERVGCGECTAAGAFCPVRVLDNDSIFSLLGIYNELLNKLRYVEQSVCDSTQSESVYSLDLTSSKEPRAICCRNIIDHTDLECEAG